MSILDASMDCSKVRKSKLTPYAYKNPLDKHWVNRYGQWTREKLEEVLPTLVYEKRNSIVSCNWIWLATRIYIQEEMIDPDKQQFMLNELVDIDFFIRQLPDLLHYKLGTDGQRVFMVHCDYTQDAVDLNERIGGG